MFTPIKNTKKFFNQHKTAIYVGGAMVAIIVIQHKSLKMMNNFLVEKDLFNEYYLGEITSS